MEWNNAFGDFFCVFFQHSVTKKGRVQESYSPYAISHGPRCSCSKSLIHIYRHLSSPAPNYLPTFVPIRFDPKLRQTQQHNTRHNTQLWSCLTHKCLIENARISFDRLCTWSESRSIALELSSLQTEGLIVSPVLSLSLLGTPATMS
jgi:hypothetical protein